MKIALVCFSLLVLILGTVSCGDSTPDYKVLNGELSMSLGNLKSFTINPSKIEVFGAADIPIIIHNDSDKVIMIDVSHRVADYLAEGYAELDIVNGEYCVYPDVDRISLAPFSNNEVLVTVERQIGAGSEHNLESWLSFAEVTDNQLRHELCLRILIK